MTQNSLKHMFIWGTVFFSIIFLYLSYDSLKQMPVRTDEAGRSLKAMTTITSGGGCSLSGLWSQGCS